MRYQLEYFTSPIYKFHIPEHIETLRQVAEENINRNGEPNDLYPVIMSNDLMHDTRIDDFANFVAQEAWKILDEQGYMMDNLTTHFQTMWMQEHYKHSAMEQHIHRGVQLVGFYFLETPMNCSNALFHDPRPGKVIMDLPQRDISQATNASEMINIEPRPGDLVLSNAWLPHSFTRHGSVKPFRFIHFNIYVRDDFQPPCDHNCETECENNGPEIV